ncbi:MAG: cysteine synthase A [Spirochaetales bacterium]|nr:cysteine synthase A [Spirochaetales bacterium]
MNIASDLTALVGKTPLVRLSRFAPGLNVLAKLELFNPGSSVKDRIALAMIEAAAAQGKIQPGATLIEPTSGNTGIGLAWIAAVKGYRLILTMPESMSVERRKLLQAFGAEIVLTSGSDGMLGAIAKAEQLLKQIPGSFQPSQFSNPENPQAHFRTTGPEIWEACDGNIDILIAGVGTGGTLSGTGRYLKEKNPQLKVIAVEPSTSAVILGKPAGPHMIQGIGGGFIPDNLDRSLLDEVVTVESTTAIEAAKDLALKEGLLAGISTGANVWAARTVAQRPENAQKTVVTFACDTGERYISTLLFYHD